MFIIDVNFKAVHLCQWYPKADVYVSDGTGFMAAQAPYLKYLDQGSSWIEVLKLFMLLYILNLTWSSLKMKMDVMTTIQEKMVLDGKEQTLLGSDLSPVAETDFLFQLLP